MEAYKKLINKKPKNYINNRDFHGALMGFYKKCQENNDIGLKQPEISRYLAECVLHIANNLARNGKFYQYTYKEDMIFDAIEKMIEAIRFKKFDTTLSENPFAYFSQISWNSFLQRIEKEKKERYIMHKYMENCVNMDDTTVSEHLDNEEHNRIIEDFEKPKDTSYPKHRNLSYDRHKPKKKKVIDF